MDQTFGEKIGEFETKGRNIAVVRVVLALGAVALVVLGLEVMFDFFGWITLDDAPAFLPYIFFAAAVGLVAVMFVFKSQTVKIFEGGFTFEKGNNIDKISFGDAKGIIDTDVIEDSVIGRATHHFTTKRNAQKGIFLRGVTVQTKNGRKMGIVNTAGYALYNAFLAYTFRDITIDNLQDLNISFGDDLSFKDRHFVLDTKKHQKQVHYSQIT
ncbi:MAG: hypothetical protein FWC69_02785 [Defluviitaleaceae bacterium]|nr:hypothetical protein [Defluviitaleaceae bacterium]